MFQPLPLDCAHHILVSLPTGKLGAEPRPHALLDEAHSVADKGGQPTIFVQNEHGSGRAFWIDLRRVHHQDADTTYAVWRLVRDVLPLNIRINFCHLLNQCLIRR